MNRTIIYPFESYPAYKPFGVKWLGEVPEHWQVRKLRRTLRAVAARNRSDLPLLSVVREKGVMLRDVSNKDENHNFIPDDLTNYKVVQHGQFAMNKMKAWQGSYGVSKFDGIVSPAYFVFDLDSVDGNYFHTAIRSKAYVPYFTQASDGVRIGQWDLSLARMREIPFLVPPLSEQTAIVRFLDHADRRIRRYIRAKQKLITLLEEQKQAIIHQAVTGQVDVRTGKPYPTYKPSGVEWLGDVPAHWETWQIGHLGQVGNGSTPSRSNMGYWDGGTYPWLNSSSVNHSPITQADQFVTDLALRECHLPQVQPGSVLVAITGQGKTRGMSAVLDTEATINQHVAYVTPRNDVIGAEYLQLALSAAYRELRAISDDSGSTKGALTCWDISHFRVPLPPSVEQAEIILVTRQATRTLESASVKAAQEVMLAREYRSRLIADVVTGKLDVREVARLPKEVEAPEPLDETDALIDGDEETADDLDTTPEEAAV